MFAIFHREPQLKSSNRIFNATDMVLKLREICLNFVTKNFDTISNFDQSLLYSPDKEKIIERLANHNLLSLNNKYNNRKSYSETEECLFRQRLIRNFFTGHLNSIKFNGCTQLDDSFLVMLVQIPANQLVFKSINFYKCRILTGKLIFKYFNFFLELLVNKGANPVGQGKAKSQSKLYQKNRFSNIFKKKFTQAYSLIFHWYNTC